MKTFGHILLTTLLSLFVVNAFGQGMKSFVGVVVSAHDGKGVESANVMLMDDELTTLYGFCITDKNGEFRFDPTASAQNKKYVLLITGFNINEKVEPVNGDEEYFRIEVESKELVIREVVVKSESEYKRGDTLSFVASSYKSISDKNIGDLMRKIPGLEVSQSGVVRYQGENINKFYIEDMDLLGGGYNVAVNNLNVDDVAKVEIYEQHQPIAALRGLSDSRSAAINIQLKDNVKGSFNGNALLGGGVDSDGALWKAELAGLYFSGKIQTIATYKTNNTGEDVTAELSSLHLGAATESSMLSIAMPITPPVSQERYFDNNSHATTLNTLVRIGTKIDLTARVSHVRESRLFEGRQHLTYLMPNGESVVVDENISAANATNRTNVTLAFRSNGEKFYINNSINLGVQDEGVEGLVVEDERHINQMLNKPMFNISNNLSIVGGMGKWMFAVDSFVNYNKSHERLLVTPLLFSQLFPADSDLIKTEQGVATNRFLTSNSISSGFRVGRWNFRIVGELNASNEELQSQLSGYTSSDVLTPERYGNDINYTFTELKLGPSIYYSTGNNFSATLNIPIRLVEINNRDLLYNTTDNIESLAPSPSFVMMYKPLRDVGVKASASYFEKFGSLYDSFVGYIMQNYRTICSKGGEIPRHFSQKYNITITYNNIFNVVSATLNGGYIRTKANIIYNTLYDGAAMTTVGVPFDNTSEQWSVNASLGKRIKSWRTTVNISAGVLESLGDVMYEKVWTNSSNLRFSAGLNFVSTPTDWSEISYSGVWSNHNNLFGATKTAAINTLQQQAKLTIALNRLWNQQNRHAGDVICFVAGQHFYNSALVAKTQNILFVDAGVGWEGELFDVFFRAQNILNNNQYGNSNSTNNLTYAYTYNMRPITFIGELMIKF